MSSIPIPAIMDAQSRVAERDVPDQSFVEGKPGAPGQPGRTASVGPSIQAHGPSASISVIGGLSTDGVALSANGAAPVKLILQHPPLGFIGAEIDVDVTPVSALQSNQPVSSDQVWIELAGVAFDRAVFVPQGVPGSDPAAPVVGALVLLQGNTVVYTLNNVHAGHYGGAGGGAFSVGVDGSTGNDYVAYAPAAAR